MTLKVIIPSRAPNFLQVVGSTGSVVTCRLYIAYSRLGIKALKVKIKLKR